MSATVLLGILYSIISGVFVASQSVINTRLSEKIGLWETSTIVHLTGFIFALLITLFIGDGDIKELSNINKFYLVGGCMGVIVVFSTMKGLGILGASYSSAILMVSQLIVATLIDTFGLFGTEQILLNKNKIIGLIIMIIGIFIYQKK